MSEPTTCDHCHQDPDIDFTRDWTGTRTCAGCGWEIHWDGKKVTLTQPPRKEKTK